MTSKKVELELPPILLRYVPATAAARDNGLKLKYGFGHVYLGKKGLARTCLCLFGIRNCLMLVHESM